MNEKNKHNLVLFLLVTTSLPFLLLVPHPANWGTDTQSLHAIELYISSVVGYIGLSMLVWQLVLGTRSISGLYFDNLVDKISLHRTLGKYGTLFLLLHPAMILLSYSENWLYAVVPSFKTQYEMYVSLGRFAAMGLVIIWVSSALLRGSIAYRPWKYIHYLSYPLLVLALLHVPNIGHSFSNPFIQFYFYTVVAIVAICFTLRLRMLFGFGKVKYQVVGSDEIRPGVWHVRLCALEKNLSVQAGQYIYLQTSLLGEEHPFSVLDYDIESQALLVAYKVYGPFTKKLTLLEPGDTMYVDGPYGTFTWQRRENASLPSVYIANGIGVTPFLKHVLSAAPENQYFFYANTSSQSALYRDALRNHLGSRLIEVLSKPSPEELALVETGRVNATMLQKYLNSPNKYNYFICGNPGLVETAKSALQTLGVQKNQIHTEEFGF